MASRNPSIEFTSCNPLFNAWYHHPTKSLFNLECENRGPNFSFAGRHCDIEPVQLRHQQSSFRSYSAWHLGDQLIVIGIFLLIHANIAFSADDVDAVTLRIKSNVIGSFWCRKAGDRFPGGGVEDHQHSRFAAHDE